MPTEKYANNASSTLSGNINSAVTDITPVAAASFPNAGQFRILIGTEIIIVGSVTAGVFHGCTRGAENTVAANHNNGDAITHLATAGAQINNPRSMTTTGDMEYLNSNGSPTRLPAPSDDNYIMTFASGVPIWTSFSAVSGFLPGMTIEYAGPSAPSGFLLCDGSAVSRATFAALFAVIGTVYGAGDGVTTFNVPDKRGRTGIGAGTGSGLSARTRGQSIGEENHLLGISEIPAHNHPIIASINSYGNILGWDPTSGDHDVGGGSAGQQQSPSGVTINASSSNTGGGSTHNNMQPSLVFNYIIKT